MRGLWSRRTVASAYSTHRTVAAGFIGKHGPTPSAARSRLNCGGLAMLREPIVGFARSPLRGLRPADMRRVPAGVPVASLAPERHVGALMCRVNGEWLLRADWAT